MKKFAKVLCVVLAVVMVLTVMTSCGSKKAGSGNLVIGGIGPLTGDYANYGVSVKQGAELAVSEINAAGGINGMTIDLKFEDSQGDPQSAVSAYGKLVDDGMNISLGAVFSGEMASVSAEGAADDIFMLSPSASADKAIETNDHAFRVCFYDSYQGTAAADYIKDNGLATEVGILYESDYDYSVGLYESFIAECEAIGIDIKVTETFTTSTDTDFSTQINSLVASGVKVIFIPIYAQEASTFLTQAHGLFDDDVFFFGADGLDGILTKVEQDPTLADNVLMLTPYSSDDTAANVSAFVSAYKAKFNTIPDQFAADGYDSIYAIKQAVEAADLKKPADCTSEALKAQFVKMTFEGVTGKMTWGEDGNTSKAAIAVIYKDGAGSIFNQ